MPIERGTLDAIARDYAAAMTSIRGRRVHRLVMRELAGFDDVRRITADDGPDALLARAGDGSVVLCQTDGRGLAATIAHRRRPGGPVSTTSYDLLKDSLSLLPAASVSKAQRERVAEALRRSA